MSLTMYAYTQALQDDGLALDDIDGLAAYPGGDLPATSGFAGPGTPAVQDALRLKLNWYSGGPEGPAQIQAVINACMAVSAGLGPHVVVYPTGNGSTRDAGRPGPAVSLSPEGGGLGKRQP